MHGQQNIKFIVQSNVVGCSSYTWKFWSCCRLSYKSGQ